VIFLRVAIDNVGDVFGTQCIVTYIGGQF